ncbi:MAG TPA: TonB family protein [Opitutaceae bacterium]|jgi:TonB family protein
MTRSLLYPYAASVAFLALTAVLSGAPPAQDPNLAVYGDALVRSWTMPQAPKGLQIGVESTVTVRFIVDATGRVTKARAIDSSDRKLNDAAIAALRQWKFSPALEEGHPIAECLDVQIMFDPADPHSLLPPIKPNPAPTTPPDVERQVDADYPADLNARQLNGKVAFRCHVDAKGIPQSTVVLNATDAGFVAPAVAAVKHWEFTPAKQGDLAVAGDVGAELDFNYESGNPKDLLAANGITAPNGKPPKKTPILRSAPAPVLPYAAVAAGKGGDADVSFVLNDNGFPEQIKVSHASSSDCGASLMAAVQTWRFDPPKPSASGCSIRSRSRASRWTCA